MKFINKIEIAVKFNFNAKKNQLIVINKNNKKIFIQFPNNVYFKQINQTSFYVYCTNKVLLDKLMVQINKSQGMLQSCYYGSLSFEGIGYKMITFKESNCYIIYFGFSEPIFCKLPNYIFLINNSNDKKFQFKSVLIQPILNSFSMLRKLRSIDNYKAKGLTYVNLNKLKYANL